MKNVFAIKPTAIMALLWMVLYSQFTHAQSSANCTLVVGGVSYPVTASVPGSIESGRDFNLSLTLPGMTSCDGNYNITITTSPNMVRGSLSTTPVSGTNPYTVAPIPTDANGENLLVAFKFRPGVTCNGETGDFTIDVKATCRDGSIVTCQLKVSLTAIAQNYWRIEKTHLWGNLKGGHVMWKIRVYQLPHTLGIGDYNIANGRLTDNINCDEVISVTGVTIRGLTGIGTNTASWSTGTISSTTSEVEYIVTTVCCNPAVNVANNCVNVSLDLGRYVSRRRPCDRFLDRQCASVPLVTAAGCTVPFTKSLVNSATTNYATGCEGEYLITIQNTGNMPIGSLLLNDVFPAGIDVTQISISASSGVSMTYNVDFGVLPSTGPGLLANATSTPPEVWTFGTRPTKIDFTTTTGAMTYGSISIRIRFKITAATGTVNNCANLTFSGTFDGWASLCGITYPPCPTNTVNSCAPFTVQPPKAIPGLSKCINGGQSYLVGQEIPFCITVSNHGQAALTGYTLADLLGPTPQNLTINSGSITYSYGTGPYYHYTPYCPTVTSGTTGSAAPPSWVTANITPQNPSWTITGMPGECRFDQASYLVIRFLAKVEPQNYGPYTNTATLTGSGSTLTSAAPYNVLRIAKVQATKLVNNGPGQPFATTGYVNAGSSFQYLLRAQNNGSVGLRNIRMTDAFPACAPFSCPAAPLSAQIFNAGGTAVASAPVTCSASGGLTTFTLPSGTVLAPGQYADVIVTVTRLTPAPEPCCNPRLTAYGTANDVGAQTIEDSDGPVCIKKSLCCDIKEMSLLQSSLVPIFSGNYYNFGLTISTAGLPIQEVEVSLMDYHVTYNNPSCKPASMGGPVGHLTSSTPNIGPGLTLTPPAVINNVLQWRAGTPVLFTGGRFVRMHIWRPNILNIVPCCKGTLYFCLKVRLKDVKCQVCEKIVCYSIDLGAPIMNPVMDIEEELRLIDGDFAPEK